MLDVILALIKERHGSDAEFEKAFGLKEKTIDSWKRKNSQAYYKKLPDLCKYFNVSSDFLLGLSDIRQPIHTEEIQDAPLLNIPPVLEDVKLAAHGGEGDWTQGEIDKIEEFALFVRGQRSK